MKKDYYYLHCKKTQEYKKATPKAFQKKINALNVKNRYTSKIPYNGGVLLSVATTKHKSLIKIQKYKL